MLSDFSWDMTGYIPKHAVNPHGDGIIPYAAERIFQLEPEPPAVGNLNEYILSALQEKNLIYFSFFLHHYEPQLNKRIKDFLGVDGGDLYDTDRFIDIKLSCREQMLQKLMDYDLAKGAEYATYIFPFIRDAMLRFRMGEEKWSVSSLTNYKMVRSMAWLYHNTKDAVSEFAKKEWLRTTKQKKTGAHVVYNCVNEAKFNKKITVEQRNKLRAQLGLKEDDFVVLYCGRIQEVKGVRELLRAFAGIKEHNCRLLIIGNADFAVNTTTPFLKEVEELVQQDTDRIRFTGYIENAELYQYYQCADMQVVPSMWEEAAGLVAIEGMLSGLPLVVTKSGGLVEYAPKEVAMQIERNGIVENLKMAIETVMDNPVERRKMSEASEKRAKDFTRSRFYNSYLKVFE